MSQASDFRLQKKPKEKRMKRKEQWEQCYSLEKEGKIKKLKKND